MHREEDGAVHFCRIKENLQSQFPHSFHWSDGRWKVCLVRRGGDKRRFQYCTDASGTIVYFRAVQGHSGRNLIDLQLQDNVTIQNNFFQYIYHVGCAFNLHSVISSGLVSECQSSSKRQTVCFLLVDLMDKSHKDPDVIDLSVPRHAQYFHKAWKRHQDAENWVDINLAITKGLKFYQTRSIAIILQETLPAYCIPKVVGMKIGEVLHEKVYMSPRPPPTISLKHEWKRELGSEHARRPEVGQLSRSFQSNQPIRERTVRPVIRDDARTVQDERKTSRSQEIDVNSFHEELVFSEGTVRPVHETSLIQVRSSEDSKDSNVEKAHERTRRFVIGTNTENVPDSSQTRSVHESVTFNVGDETLRERTARPVIDHDVIHEKIMVNEADMDSRIPGLPNSVVKQEALLYVFEDNEAVIKMVLKGRSPTMRHVSRTHRVALDWLFDRIKLDPKNQIKYIDTKNQLADILTKGNFTHDEWNHLLTLFNISHFSSTSCIAAMAKRAQQESGEGRVTAKSRPMMNLTARTPSFVSSSASANPGRSSHGYQDPKQPVLDDRAGKPVETSRSNYSQDYGPSWSSQVWKSGDGEHDRPGQPEKTSWDSLGKLTLIVENIFSAGRRILQGTKRLFTIERGDPLQRMSKERLIFEKVHRGK